MATIHDFAEQLAQVVPRNFVVHVQVVGEDVTADVQVAVVERVHSRPSLGSEFLPRQNERVEGTEAEQDSLVLGLLRTLVDSVLAEKLVGPQHVGLHVLGCLITDFDTVLQNGLRDQLHGRHGWRFRRQEAPKLLVRGRRDFVQLQFEQLGPGLHQVDVVQDYPVSVLRSLHECLVRAVFLALAHGNFDQGVVGNGLVVLACDLADVFGWLHAGEEHEEQRNGGVRLVLGLHHVEWRLLGLLGAHLLGDLVLQRVLHAVGSQCAEEEQFLEFSLVEDEFGEALAFGVLLLVPLAPLDLLLGDVLDDVHVEAFKPLNHEPVALLHEFELLRLGGHALEGLAHDEVVVLLDGDLALLDFNAEA
mmetsp:Transcript_71961/g.155416  ORF Transcript_71961/g.155416 Transcript_71961/m.155416 type:complete len:361 (-) Transcript_71961:3180-4262(-)